MSKKIKVIKVIDNYTLVINSGSDDGVTDQYEFLVYSLDEELFDPDTNESLGALENVKGIAIPIHIQNKMTTIKSNQYLYSENKKIIKRSGGLTFGGNEEIIEPKERRMQPFSNPEINDFVKIIDISRRL